MTQTELKACPHCGTTSLTVGCASANWSIYCAGCSVGFGVFNRKLDAIKWWNTRPLRPEGGVREALQEAIHVIRIFHGLGMPKETEAKTWKIYNEHSPEMKRINAALSLLPPQEGKGETK